jgi:hypothetical protein
MPSDPVLDAALRAVSRRHEAYRSAVAAAADRVRGLLGRGAPARDAAASLGAFARGRVDFERFAGLAERSRPLDPDALASLATCADVLGRIAAATPAELLVVRVPEGGDLRDVVAAALARLGRAFGAARLAHLAQQGRWRAEDAAALLAPLPPRAWTRRERRLAPPLVVEVDGADCRASSLAEFLDGAQRFVLVVRGRAPAAPLARLVTPGTHVVQTGDATGLDAFAASEGPGVAAILEDGARFSHDPAAGDAPWRRIAVRRLPEGEPRTPCGGLSIAQQVEDLRHLRALAARPEPAAAPASAPVSGSVPAAPADGDPAARLAACLLGSVDLADLG